MAGGGNNHSVLIPIGRWLVFIVATRLLESVNGTHKVIMPIHAIPTASAHPLSPNSVPLLLEVGRDLWLLFVP